MDYDVVIATRNRAEVLKISIPLILEQSRPPRKLIVVDSSDNHNLVRRTVQDVASGVEVSLDILHSQKTCSAHQRNVGLEHVDSQVVMFPDDDSLWWPGVAEAIMQIYELDKNEDIGGVCARETKETPPGVDLTAGNIYRMRRSDQIRQKIGRLRHRFEDKFCPDPLWIHGRSRWDVCSFPQCLQDIDSALVEFMGGFRMSFRTELIRRYGFDEDLGIHIGYAAYEDADASFKILQDKLLVGAHDAHVYHYKAPSQRANGFKLGFFLLFNRAYIICKYSSQGAKSRRLLKRFGRYKLVQYLMAILDSYGRDRVRGTLVALKSIDELLNCQTDELREKYLKICERVINKHSYGNNE